MIAVKAILLKRKFTINVTKSTKKYLLNSHLKKKSNFAQK